MKKILLVLFLIVAQGFAQFPTFSKFPNFIPTGTTVYNPIDANTTYFWRADQGITLAATKISQWDDQVGSFDFVQGTDANRPTFNSDSVAAYFTAANSTFMATTSSPTMDTSTFSIDFYVNIPNKDTAQTIITEYQLSSTSWQIVLSGTGAGELTFQAIKSSTNIHNTKISATTYTAGARNCFTVAVLAGTSDAWYINGTSVASTDAYNVKSDFNNTGTFRIGKLNTTSYFRGYIYAIRISNKVRSEAEHEAFYAWCQETF